MRLWKRTEERLSGGRRTVLVLSDTHSGGRLALLNPETVLTREDEDGNVEEWTPELGATQQWLWGCFTNCIDRAVELAGDSEIVVIHAGDATNGDWYGGNIPETTREDQRTIAVANLMPLATLPQVHKVRLMTGTAVHVPDCAEARIARRLAAETGTDAQAGHHSRAIVNDVIFDLAHHGPFPGSRDWLHGNVAMYYLRSAVYGDRRVGKEPARVYVRGHYHTYVPAHLDEVWCGEVEHHSLVVVPSFSGLTPYARKATRSAPVLTVGMVAFVVEDGRLVDTQPLIHQLDLRMEETL